MAKIINLEFETTDEVKPCPFCGNEDIELCNTWTASYWIKCGVCGAEMHGLSYNEMGEYNPEAHQKAKGNTLSKWNMRHVALTNRSSGISTAGTIEGSKHTN